MTAVNRAGCTNIKDPVSHVERFVGPISVSLLGSLKFAIQVMDYIRNIDFMPRGPFDAV